MTLPTTIRVNVRVPFPTSVTGTAFMQVIKANGVWTVTPNYTLLAPSPPTLTATQSVALQDTATGIWTYSGMSALLAQAFNSLGVVTVDVNGNLAVNTGGIGNASVTINGASGSAAQNSYQSAGVTKWRSGNNASNQYAIVDGSTTGSLSPREATRPSARRLRTSRHSRAAFSRREPTALAMRRAWEWAEPSLGTSKATGVTLSKASGQITMNAASLAASTTVSFTLTNTNIAATDILVLNHVSAGTAGSYTLDAQCGSGTATINVRNVSSDLCPRPSSSGSHWSRDRPLKETLQC